MAGVHSAFAKAKPVQFFKTSLKAVFMPFIYIIFHLVEIPQTSFFIQLIFVLELKKTVMDFTHIKNSNVLKIVYNRRIILKSYKMVVVYRRVKKPVVQLVTS
jgi:hypothetical protein